MLRMVKRLIALSLGVHREQLLQRMGLTWPRPFLLRPLFFLFLTILALVLESWRLPCNVDLVEAGNPSCVSSSPAIFLEAICPALIPHTPHALPQKP
jgi:hypothetical protein